MSIRSEVTGETPQAPSVRRQPPSTHSHSHHRSRSHTRSAPTDFSAPSETGSARRMPFRSSTAPTYISQNRASEFTLASEEDFMSVSAPTYGSLGDVRDREPVRLRQSKSPMLAGDPTRPHVEQSVHGSIHRARTATRDVVHSPRVPNRAASPTPSTMTTSSNIVHTLQNGTRISVRSIRVS